MITINTARGVIEMPCPEADDGNSIMGRCEHGISLFDPCFDCIWLDNYGRFVKTIESSRMTAVPLPAKS